MLICKHVSNVMVRWSVGIDKKRHTLKIGQDFELDEKNDQIS